MSSMTIDLTVSTKIPQTMLEDMILRIRSKGLPN